MEKAPFLVKKAIFLCTTKEKAKESKRRFCKVMRYGRERRGFGSPIDIGKTYDVTIEELGREGDGIARIEGFVVFVPNTKKGDSVKIRVTRVSERVGFAEVVEG